MALFTETQADACTIKHCASYKSDGVHICWCFRVIDEDGYVINWLDKTCPEAATDDDLKAAIRNHLITSVEKKTVIPPVFAEVVRATIIDTTIGG